MFPSPVRKDGPGWRAEVDLPYGVTAAQVIERREQLAPGLRRPLGAVWPEPVTHEHAGRLELWVGRQDVAEARQAAWPLARGGQADVFTPVPFGTDVRDRGELPDREDRDRPRSVPGPPLRRLVPAHHPGHARARLPGRHGGDRPKSTGSGLVSLTLGEVRRLLAHLITTVPGRAAALAWSRWRRRHQHRAKTSHYQRRHAQHNKVLLEY